MSAVVGDARPTVTVDGDTVQVASVGLLGPAGADGADGADGVGPISVVGVQNALVVAEQETLATIGSGPSGAAGYTTDLPAAMLAQGIDTSTGRIGANYVDGGVDFEANARYAEEQVNVEFQLPHSYVEGSSVNFHLHWIQNQDAVPNWLGRYRVLPLGGAVGAWSSLVALDATDLVFTYTSGSLHQITDFFDIDMTGAGISSIVQVQFWRDSANTSTLFAGADAYSGAATALSADLHYLCNSIGSVGAYDKDGL